MKHKAKLPELNELSAGNAIFQLDAPIWLSEYGDPVWKWCEEDSPLSQGKRGNGIYWQDYLANDPNSDQHSRRHHAQKYEYVLTPSMNEDLRRAAVIYSKFPNILRRAKNSKINIKPVTVNERIIVLAQFFSIVIIYLKQEHHINVEKLSEIPFSAVVECIPLYQGRSDALKRALTLISDPNVQKNLLDPLQWNFKDLDSNKLSWRKLTEHKGISTLPDSLFLFLLSYCKKSVLKFKILIDQNPHDSSMPLTEANQIHQSLPNFKDALDLYYSTARPKKLPLTYGYGFKDVHNIIKDSHNAAIMLILLFTGMRESETKFVSTESMEYRHGYYFIKSKVVKQHSNDEPVSEGWLAINLVRDAYDVLKYFCAANDATYLFSTPLLGMQRREGLGYAFGTLNTKFNRWIAEIDKEGLYKDWKFSVHQCRETLVYQLACHDVGLPFISMHLKHFHDRFSLMPNEVTAGYGNYKKQLMDGILNQKATARENVLLEFYGEDSVFAGGGATEHKTRIDAFFAGAGLYGKDREKYIKQMAQQGVNLMPTSIGACTKNFRAIRDGEAKPPCFGDYECDPNCNSHVMTKGCAESLKTRRDDALIRLVNEDEEDFKVVWKGLADKLDQHIGSLTRRGT